MKPLYGGYSPENPRPVVHTMTRAGDIPPEQPLSFTGDGFYIAPHGFATSHLDALCHRIYKGQMYNGFPGTEVRSTGARRGSILCACDGVVGRGVLLDIPRLHGVPYLEPGTAITPDELDGGHLHGLSRPRELVDRLERYRAVRA